MSSNLKDVLGSPRHSFVEGDICDNRQVQNVLKQYQPTKIMHLAAETHVDNSIDRPADFIITNVLGTHNLLQSSTEYWKKLSSQKQKLFKFHHVSTDEVYGDLDLDSARFNEQTPYKPSSPYSASKAASDHFVRAWYRTYGLPTVVSNCSNNYGPYQFPEKLIPVVISKALNNEPIPVYGAGQQIRDWLHVDDHAKGLYTIVMQAAVGETYNIGADCEWRNIDLVTYICEILDELKPAAYSYKDYISFVTDRPGHDKRYAIDSTKMKADLGWTPDVPFDEGLKATVSWYLDNQTWLNAILEEARSAA